MTNKAVSVRYPWIQLILAGRRPLEVRGRATAHRGEVYLHVSRTYGRVEREATAQFGLRDPEPGVLGSVIGKAILTGCRLMTAGDWEAAGLPPRDKRLWAWRLEAPETVDPFPVQGQRFLFDVELPRRKRDGSRSAA
jgi:hypothetical protein